jgi:hypothetical protein
MPSSPDRRVAPPSGMAPPVRAPAPGGGELDLVALASEATDRFCDRVPDYQQRYADGVGRAWAMHDLQHLINWAALDVAGRTSLDEQVAWLAGVLAARDFPVAELRLGLELAADVVDEQAPGAGAVADALRRGAATLSA